MEAEALERGGRGRTWSQSLEPLNSVDAVGYAKALESRQILHVHHCGASVSYQYMSNVFSPVKQQ